MSRLPVSRVPDRQTGLPEFHVMDSLGETPVSAGKNALYQDMHPRLEREDAQPLEVAGMDEYVPPAVVGGNEAVVLVCAEELNLSVNMHVLRLGFLLGRSPVRPMVHPLCSYAASPESEVQIS